MWFGQSLGRSLLRQWKDGRNRGSNRTTWTRGHMDYDHIILRWCCGDGLSLNRAFHSGLGVPMVTPRGLLCWFPHPTVFLDKKKDNLESMPIDGKLGFAPIFIILNWKR